MILSAVVAHELKNISVALGGFLDLAAADGAPLDLILQSLNEVRIGLQRVNRLSADLESLADAVSVSVPITISDCLLATVDGPTDLADRIVWLCNRSEKVRVDPAHARRAVEALARLSKSPVELMKLEQISAAARCDSCGSRLSLSRGFVGVQARGLRLPVGLTARDPLNPEVKSLAVRRLIFTVMVNSVHNAGGHLVAEPAEDAVSLLLPLV
jgi:hypothetical protein